MCERMSADTPQPTDAPPRGAAREPDELAAIEAEEVVDGLPVLAEVRAIERTSPALPAVQAAAAAATGFVAGAATLALVRRHGARKLARVSARPTVGGLSIVGTRSFLVNVHLIAKPGE